MYVGDESLSNGERLIQSCASISLPPSALITCKKYTALAPYVTKSLTNRSRRWHPSCDLPE